jgi:hypothetical protein
MEWCSLFEPLLISASVWADHAPGTADIMAFGLSLVGAMVSGVINRARWTAHSSDCWMKISFSEFFWQTAGN